MAVKIRLARHGAKKAPYYRIVAAEASAPRDGTFIEQLGDYDPTCDPFVVRLKPARLRHWLSRGAKPTQTVRVLLDKFLDRAERLMEEHGLAPDKAVWVQGPDNHPAAQGVKGSPAYRPFRVESIADRVAAQAGVAPAPADEGDAAAPDTPAASDTTATAEAEAPAASAAPAESGDSGVAAEAASSSPAPDSASEGV